MGKPVLDIRWYPRGSPAIFPSCEQTGLESGKLTLTVKWFRIFPPNNIQESVKYRPGLGAIHFYYFCIRTCCSYF